MVSAEEEINKPHYRTEKLPDSPAASTSAWWDDLGTMCPCSDEGPPTSPSTLQRSNKLVDLLDAPLARITGQEHGVDAL